ncbi:MAG: ribose transport system substrate-binding protein [Kosmotogales bacterium]|nr:ribose transport system substrate-binding protein [Kosmotogales bacterium]
MKGKKVLLVSLAIMLLLATVSFAANPLNLGNNALEGKKIGFIQLTLGTTYHAAMSDEFDALAADYGIEFDQVVSANRSAAEQLSLAEDLIAKGVEVLILNPVGDEIVPSVVALCEMEGIPLFCVDNTSAGEGYVYVGIDNFAIAREIGRLIGEAMGGEAKMVYVRSTATDTGCPALRFGGIMGGISDQGEVKGYDLIDERYATQDVGEADGMLQMEELLNANPEIDVVIAHHDAQALGALTAIRNQGRDDVKLIVGFDGEKRMLEEIKAGGNGKNGPALVTGLNSPTMIADLTITLINDLFSGETLSNCYYIPVVGISYENVDEYMELGF